MSVKKCFHPIGAYRPLQSCQALGKDQVRELDKLNDKA